MSRLPDQTFESLHASMTLYMHTMHQSQYQPHAAMPYQMHTSGGNQKDYNVSDEGGDSIRAVSKPCEPGAIECNPQWDLTLDSLLTRIGVNFGAGFLMTMVSLLLMVSSDPVTSPYASAFGPTMTILAMETVFETYTFNPMFVLAEALVPIAPCTPKPSTTSSGRSSALGWTEGSLHMMHRLGRAAFTITFQLLSSVIGSLVVWHSMAQPGVDVASRFNTHVRSDISDSADGSTKVFFFVFIFNALYACIVYLARFMESDEKTGVTCIRVHRKRTPMMMIVTSVGFFLLTAAMAPMFGVGGLNVMFSLGPAMATWTMPAFFGSFLIATALAPIAIAVFMRYVVFAHKRTCANC